MAKRKIRSFEDFLFHAKLAHGDRYSYDEKSYVGASKILTIECRTHGIFEQPANVHALKGQGCPSCRQTTAFDEFKSRATLIHGPRYRYYESSWKKLTSKTKIKCSRHGVFEQSGASHLKGRGCPSCSAERASEGLKFPFASFVEKAREIHGDRYEYDEASYRGTNQKIQYTCSLHGVQSQQGSSHLKGMGCSGCSKKSSGEEEVQSYLDSRGVIYEREKSFPSLRDRGLLRFDFYLPDSMTLIEFDGVGHRSPIRWGSMSPEEAEKNFQDCLRRDKLKDDWALANGYRLIRLTDVSTVSEELDSYFSC